MSEVKNDKIQIKEIKPEDHRTEEFFNLIIETFKEGLDNKGIKEKIIKTPSELKGYAFDLPKKEKGIYHGSSFEILCKSTWCRLKGDLVVETEREEIVNRELERSGKCRIFETHRHISHKNENLPPESHIHFMCLPTDRFDTLKMVNFLKDLY